jgi:hypothetical protein
MVRRTLGRSAVYQTIMQAATLVLVYCVIRDAHSIEAFAWSILALVRPS